MIEREACRSAFHRHHCIKGQVHDLAFCISRTGAPTLARMPQHAPPTLADILRAHRHVRGQPRDVWMYAHVNAVVSPR